MPFLAINGWPIEIREIKESVEYLGGIKRVFKGTATNLNNGIKRKWEITTTPLPIEKAEALKRFVAGVGDHFSFKRNNSWSNSMVDLASDKGVVPSSGYAILSPYEGQNYFNALCLDSGTHTNLLSQNQASFETDLSGWTINATGLSTTRMTNGGYHGSAYLRIRHASGTDTYWSMTADNIPVTAETTYYFSWFQRNNIDLTTIDSTPGNFTTAIVWKDSAGAVISTTYATSLGPADINWHRVYFSGTAPTEATQCALRIGFDLPNFTANQFLDIDGIQFEENRLSPFAYTSSTYSKLTYPYSCFDISNSEDLTIFTRIKLKSSATQYAFLTIYSTNGLYKVYTLFYGHMNYKPYVVIPFDDYSVLSRNVGTAVNLETWYSQAFTHKIGQQKIYQNGSLISTDSYNKQRLKTRDESIVLNPSFPYDSQYFDICDIYLLPYVLPDEAISGIHSCPYISEFPELIAYGDFLPSPYVIVLGEIEDFDYIQYFNNGAWTTGQIIKFTLYEV